MDTLARSLARPRKIPLNDVAKIVTRYCAGESTNSLAVEFKVTPSSISSLLRAREIPLRPHWGAHNLLPLNHGAFKEITPETAYWVGFLMADGCVQENAVTLALAIYDREHVEKFKAFLGSGHKIQIAPGRTAPSARFSVRSTPIVTRLRDFGVTPKKSAIAAVIGLENNRDFWRGVTDGDGSFGAWGKRAQVQFQMCGSLALMTQFRVFCERTLGPVKSSVRKRSTIFCFSLSGREARQMLDVLYTDASVALTRKSYRASALIAGRLLSDL